MNCTARLAAESFALQLGDLSSIKDVGLQLTILDCNEVFGG